MTDVSGSPPAVDQVPTCFRHPDRETYIRCQRCGRYICPDCMRQASVGFHCPECVAEGAASVREPQTSYGGAVRDRSDLVTKLLIALNVAVFVLIQISGGVESPLLYRLEMIGSTSFIGGIGATSGVAEGGYWRLLTSVFVHVQLFHLLFNMMAVWIFGPMLESLLGRLRFLALFLVCGLAGSVAVYLLAPPLQPTIGASGAAFGLLGAALLISLKRGYDVRWLVGLLAINLVFTFIGPRISWQGHLGGLVAGLLLGWAIAYAPAARRKTLLWGAFGGVFALSVALVVGRTLVLT